MLCPYCQSPRLYVSDKRNTEGNTIRRRRGCLVCGRRFTTREKIDTLDLMVIKKDGRRQRFEREKLAQGILKSCINRPIPSKTIENLISEVEGEICSLRKNEIAAEAIGEIVLKALKKLDTVAYLRFASVFRSFANIDDFEKEIGGLMEKGGERKKPKRGK